MMGGWTGERCISVCPLGLSEHDIHKRCQLADWHDGKHTWVESDAASDGVRLTIDWDDDGTVTIWEARRVPLEAYPNIRERGRA